MPPTGDQTGACALQKRTGPGTRTLQRQAGHYNIRRHRLDLWNPARTHASAPFASDRSPCFLSRCVLCCGGRRVGRGLRLDTNPAAELDVASRVKGDDSARRAVHFRMDKGACSPRASAHPAALGTRWRSLPTEPRTAWRSPSAAQLPHGAGRARARCPASPGGRTDRDTERRIARRNRIGRASDARRWPAVGARTGRRHSRPACDRSQECGQPSRTHGARPVDALEKPQSRG